MTKIIQYIHDLEMAQIDEYMKIVIVAVCHIFKNVDKGYGETKGYGLEDTKKKKKDQN